MPKARYSRRRIPCNGQCGKKGCTYRAQSKAALKRHLNKEKNECLVCKKTYSQKVGRDRHMRNKHPDEAITYLGVPTTCLKCPGEFEGTGMTDHWQFLKAMVRRNIQNDRRKKNLRPQDRILLASMYNNTTVHNLASQIARRILKDELLEKNATDAFGGFLPNGLMMRSHGGLFKLSLDRLQETHLGGEHCIHFFDPNNAMANIRLVPFALNMGHCGAFTLNTVQEAAGQPVDLVSLLDYESKSEHNDRGNSTTLYRCCNNIFKKDEQARDAFGSPNAMWRQWARQRLEAIKGRCEISGIPLRTNQQKGSPFQMSIDAIQPTLGHVPGNMRIVCRFLNPVCCDKNKTYDDPSDGPSQWTPELFRQYFRIPDAINAGDRRR